MIYAPPLRRTSLRLSALSLPLLFLGALCLAVAAASQQRPHSFAWMESETPVTANVKFQAAGWGHEEFLSGRKWLQVSIDADKVEKELPPRGAVLEYGFQAATAGRYEVWNRIGYEFARSPFEWRVDEGAWARIGPEQLTTDLMELQDWNEVAWLKMGDAPLTPGAHRLSIRLPKTLDDKGKTARVLYASDALCVHLGPWTPYSHFKPGEDWRDAKDREAARKVFQAPSTAGELHPGGAALSLAGFGRSAGTTSRRRARWPLLSGRSRGSHAGRRFPCLRTRCSGRSWMAHRLWYRARINVPAADMGHSFRIAFPQNNLNTTVMVNGVLCGFNKNPYAHFEIDITKGIKPGINELWVGFRDAYYGYSASPKDPMKLRRKFNLPLSFSHQGFQDLAYPVWGAFQSGILATPKLIIEGPVYASDVFVKPSVAKKELAAEVTLTNTLAKEVSGTLSCRAYIVEEHRLDQSPHWSAQTPFSLRAGETKTFTIRKAWANPKLWWPDDPQLYLFHTTVAPTAVGIWSSRSERFGFREWTVDGIHLKLNGINYHALRRRARRRTPDEWLATHHKIESEDDAILGHHGRA